MAKQVIYKPVGLTPLQALEKLRKEKPELSNETLSFIGRLDPMAEGIMLVLVGEENKNREQYLHLDKEYEFEVLFGVTTDTYDILGKITLSRFTDERIKIDNKFLNQFMGKKTQPYPPFSSKTVNGKPLWEYSREGNLDKIEIPTKAIEIYDLRFENERTISKDELKKSIFNRISLVNGDFRQVEIKKSWERFFETTKQDNFQVFSFNIACSSGTYVRSLVNEMGKVLGVGAVAFSIKRTKIGNLIYNNYL